VNRSSTCQVGRRAFLANGSLILAASLDSVSRACLLAADSPKKDGVRVGLVTDLHYADKKPAGTRHYRETPDKLAEAAEKFKKDGPAFVVELGDLIDAADSVETELKYHKRIDRDFAPVSKDRHYVLGNHCPGQPLRRYAHEERVPRRCGPEGGALLVRPRRRPLRRTRRLLPK
jgi:hypothetical protein